ncbi:hypothetical protein BY458DRAFT_508957 [Sporodiniella umbellata]|nr:hypothetical protein BY458DRAFT_508957 [Sporodiniella umbellata]
MNGCQSLMKDTTLENMKYAIALTLCELSSAKIKPPNECYRLEKPKQTGLCIQKLSFSPQAWTSYSGYFRDIALICFAIRYPLEKEILERLYRNITLGQQKNFEILQHQQADFIQWREQELHWLAHLRQSQSDLAHLMKTTEADVKRNQELVEGLMVALTAMKSRTEQSMVEYTDMISTHLSGGREELQAILSFQSLKTEGAVDEILAQLSRVSLCLEQIQVQTTQDWHQHLTQLERDSTQKWQELIDTARLDLQRLVQDTSGQIQHMAHLLTGLKEQLAHVTQPLERLGQHIKLFYVYALGLIQDWILQWVAWTLLCYQLQVLFIRWKYNKTFSFALSTVFLLLCRQHALDTYFILFFLLWTYLCFQLYRSFQSTGSSIAISKHSKAIPCLTLKDQYHFHRYYSYRPAH